MEKLILPRGEVHNFEELNLEAFDLTEKQCLYQSVVEQRTINLRPPEPVPRPISVARDYAKQFFTRV